MAFLFLLLYFQTKIKQTKKNDYPNLHFSSRMLTGIMTCMQLYECHPPKWLVRVPVNATAEFKPHLVGAHVKPCCHVLITSAVFHPVQIKVLQLHMWLQEGSVDRIVNSGQ